MIKPPPYGYKVMYGIANGKVVNLPREIVPEQAEVVRRIFSEYLAGRSYVRIARDLNRDNIRSQKGKPWHANCVRGVVMNPVYCGKIRTRFDVKFNGRKIRKPDTEWILFDGKHRQIISEAKWEEAQTLRRGKIKMGRAKGSPLLLSGLLRCGYCGSAMCKDGSWGGGYYICGNYKSTHNCKRNGYRRIHLEKHVLQYISAMLTSEDIFEEVKNQQQTLDVQELTSRITRTEKLLADLPLRRNRLFELYENGNIPVSEFLERKANHDSFDQQISSQLSIDRAAVQRHASSLQTRQTFEENLKTFQADLGKCDIALQKTKLAALIDRIVIQDENAKIHFRIDDQNSFS